MTTNNEALANLLATTPGTLATAQHVALKAHVLSVLNQFVRAVETETYGLRELPACADAAGVVYMDFGFATDEPLDFEEVFSKLRRLKDVANFGPL